jgi:hypothetical protein
VFGLPSYSPPAISPRGTVTIREGLNGAQVPDAAVGGTIPPLCTANPNYIWNEWGNRNYGSEPRFNIQNQADVADWPCFAKYYVTFPLNAVPAGGAVLSAKLTLHQFGGSDPSRAFRSLIQVFTISEDWSESTLSWNNAPLAQENVGRAWAEVVDRCNWPCEPREFDVSGAAAGALAAGQPLRLALYSADTAMHSGKYFIGSEEADWNAAARPTLTIVWGDRAGGLTKTAAPLAPQAGQAVAYRLTFAGNGSPLTLQDQLPAGLGAPFGLSASHGNLQYDPGANRLTWSGTPAQGQQVTLTYSTNVQTNQPQLLVNTASLVGTGLSTSASAAVIANGFKVMLPFITK